MQAITVKCLEATDTLGQRIKASLPNGKFVVIPRDYAKPISENEWMAARKLAYKYSLPTQWVTASLNKMGHVVFVPANTMLYIAD